LEDVSPNFSRGVVSGSMLVLLGPGDSTLRDVDADAMHVDDLIINR